MSRDVLRDSDLARPKRSEDPRSRGGRRTLPSSRPPPGSTSQGPKSRGSRSRDKSGVSLSASPAVIEEELWFGGHDAALAEDTAARSMAALVGRIVGAKPFPESARRLEELTRKEVTRIEPIVQVLERDPALSARLLRLVNSAGYALQQRCTSVRHAATLVGTDRLHQIATTAAVLDLFDARGPVAARIITHSTIVGAFCRYFGAHLALPVDDLFTAGFLHDIGKLMLLETEGDQYVALLNQYAETPDAIHVAERSLYGFDHAVLAAHVLHSWNIPDPVPKIVAWHHDPGRAYRVSSMMAALVQTVRLADAAVYATLRDVDRETFAALAATESASYLDISEPQLASMWEELQALYHESVEQCRGENAPALDPRSLRPKQPLSVAAGKEPSRTAELPLQFPCVVCGGPTFGNACSACGGPMCPEHQVGREDWCTLCARDYHSQESEAPLPMSPKLALVIGAATTLVSIAIGYEADGTGGGVRTGIGTLLLLALTAVLTIIGRRWLLRFKFVRTRPDRNMVTALENDGGLKSLVPPINAEPHPNHENLQDPLSERIRLSGALVERVIIDDVPSIPDIIAPRPFDGLHSAPTSTRHPNTNESELEFPTAPSEGKRDRSFTGPNPTPSTPRNPNVVESRIEPTTTHADSAQSRDGSRPAAAAQLSRLTESQLDVPAVPDSNRQPFDAERLKAQTMSLVTLPAPALEAEAIAPEQPIQTLDSQPTTATEDAPLSHPPILASTHEAAEPPAPSGEPDETSSSPATEEEELHAASAIHPLAALGFAERFEHVVQSQQPGPASDMAREDDATPFAQASPPGACLPVLPDSTANPVETRAVPAMQEPTSAAMAISDETGLARVASVSEAAPVAAQAAQPELLRPPLSRASAPVVERVVLKEVTNGRAAAVTEAAKSQDDLVPLAKMLKSEPPPAPKSLKVPDELTQAVAGLFGSDFSSKLGPEFQARVIELAAQRVAAALAEQMLQSLGQTMPSVPAPTAPRRSRVGFEDIEPPPATLDPAAAPKRRRRRPSSH